VVGDEAAEGEILEAELARLADAILDDRVLSV